MPAPVHRSCLVLLVFACAAPACAGRLEDVIRAQAAGDLSCPESQVTVRGRSGGDYAVTACGRERSYQTACNSLGTCVAFPVGEGARATGATGREDLWADRDESVAQSDPAVAGSGAEVSAAEVSAVAGALAADDVSTAGAAAAGDVPAATEVPAAAVVGPSGEARAVALRNDCERTVALFIGEDPAKGAGRYTSLGSMNTATLQLRPGEPVWLLDAKGAGLTSVGVDGSVREIAVLAGCGGLSAR